jgi:hypothetical protein
MQDPGPCTVHEVGEAAARGLEVDIMKSRRTERRRLQRRSEAESKMWLTKLNSGDNGRPGSAVFSGWAI